MKYYTVKEVAELFRVNPYTIRRWVHFQKLPCMRIGLKILIPESAIGASREVMKEIKPTGETSQNPPDAGNMIQTQPADNYSSTSLPAEPSDTS